MDLSEGGALAPLSSQDTVPCGATAEDYQLKVATLGFVQHVRVQLHSLHDPTMQKLRWDEKLGRAACCKVLQSQPGRSSVRSDDGLRTFIVLSNKDCKHRAEKWKQHTRCEKTGKYLLRP